MADESKDAAARAGYQHILGVAAIKRAFTGLWKSCHTGERCRDSVPVVTKGMGGSEAHKRLMGALIQGVTSAATVPVKQHGAAQAAFQLVAADGTVSPLPDTAQQLQDHPLASPSPFGDLVSGTDKVDTTVRHAFDILGKHLRVDKALTDDLAQLFTGVTGAECRAELYKVCVYPVGAGFAMHQDTPLPGMLGTAVVELYVRESWRGPPPRTGGDLVLEVDGKATAVSQHHAVVFLPWVRHCVTPVRKGHRVSALFRIYRTGHEEGDEAKGETPTAPVLDVEGVVDDGDVSQVFVPGTNTAAEKEERSNVWGTHTPTYLSLRVSTGGYRDVVTCVQALMGLASTSATPRRIFVVLPGVYSTDQLQDMARGAGGSALLGTDRQLHDALVGKGLEVAVSPCALVHAVGEGGDNDPDYETEYSAMHLVYLDGDDVEAAVSGLLARDTRERQLRGLDTEGVGEPVSKEDLAKAMEATAASSKDEGQYGYWFSDDVDPEVKRRGPAPVFGRRLADATHARDLFACDESMNRFCVMLNENKNNKNYGVTLYHDYAPHIEYTGNESQYGYSANLYFSVCLVVQQAVPTA